MVKSANISFLEEKRKTVDGCFPGCRRGLEKRVSRCT
jgi:hypothetical protein